MNKLISAVTRGEVPKTPTSSQAQEILDSLIPVVKFAIDTAVGALGSDQLAMAAWRAKAAQCLSQLQGESIKMVTMHPSRDAIRSLRKERRGIKREKADVERQLAMTRLAQTQAAAAKLSLARTIARTSHNPRTRKAAARTVEEISADEVGSDTSDREEVIAVSKQFQHADAAMKAGIINMKARVQTAIATVEAQAKKSADIVAAAKVAAVHVYTHASCWTHREKKNGRCPDCCHALPSTPCDREGCSVEVESIDSSRFMSMNPFSVLSEKR